MGLQQVPSRSPALNHDLSCLCVQALSVGIFPYVLKLLQSSARELRPLLVFIWAKILAVDSVSCVKHSQTFGLDSLIVLLPGGILNLSIYRSQTKAFTQIVADSCKQLVRELISVRCSTDVIVWLASDVRVDLPASSSSPQSCQADLVKDNGHKYFLSVLADSYMPVSSDGVLLPPPSRRPLEGKYGKMG